MTSAKRTTRRTAKTSSEVAASSGWQFRARFRKRAFGWQSPPAIQRIQEAVEEVTAAAKKDPLHGAEGAVLLLERLSPAMENVDGSSGAAGAAVDWAIREMVAIIGTAPAEPATRAKWLERMWAAWEKDEVPWIERLTQHWGEACGSREVASEWADRLIGRVETSFCSGRNWDRFFRGEPACFSALLKAERYEDLERLIAKAPRPSWDYREWIFRALVARGRPQEALALAEASRGRHSPDAWIDAACEALLLSMGERERAWPYALRAYSKATYLATFRWLASRYPERPPEGVLRDLMATTPGEEGKWFAAARHAGLLDLALDLARSHPTEPRVLTRAARDLLPRNPEFSLEAALAAIRWMLAGHGYKLKGVDVLVARDAALAAGERLGRQAEVEARIATLVAERPAGETLVSRYLG